MFRFQIELFVNMSELSHICTIHIYIYIYAKVKCSLSFTFVWLNSGCTGSKVNCFKGVCVAFAIVWCA